MTIKKGIKRLPLRGSLKAVIPALVGRVLFSFIGVFGLFGFFRFVGFFRVQLLQHGKELLFAHLPAEFFQIAVSMRTGMNRHSAPHSFFLLLYHTGHHLSRKKPL